VTFTTVRLVSAL